MGDVQGKSVLIVDEAPENLRLLTVVGEADRTAVQPPREIPQPDRLATLSRPCEDAHEPEPTVLTTRFFPFDSPTRQLCTVEPAAPANVRVGDIVLCKVRGAEYLHLVKAMQGEGFKIGNIRGFINGWIGANGIFGRLVGVER